MNLTECPLGPNFEHLMNGSRFINERLSGWAKIRIKHNCDEITLKQLQTLYFLILPIWFNINFQKI